MLFADISDLQVLQELYSLLKKAAESSRENSKTKLAQAAESTAEIIHNEILQISFNTEATKRPINRLEILKFFVAKCQGGNFDLELEEIYETEGKKVIEYVVS